MAYRNKIYVCFDGDEDMKYYRLMQAWHEHNRISFSFYNAHDLNSARDTSTEYSIKRQLRERLLNTKTMIVLIGEKTKNLHRFVRWEMEQALKLGIPIIAVNLNGKRQLNAALCPPVIRDELAVHISYKAAIIQYALQNWGAQHAAALGALRSQPHYYPDSIYKKLGL